uniref:WAP domain-containing protein n=1 Tax=Pelusios castaneus TaxID=367368 RepID=A0A8C8VGH3_9SAUR
MTTALGSEKLWKILQRKPGTCPEVIFKCAMLNPPNRCYSDRQCPRFKKCCETFCGRNCIYLKGYVEGTNFPHPFSQPGPCPNVIFKCATYNLLNRCRSDHQCPQYKKCCETFCGRKCTYLRGTSLI